MWWEELLVWFPLLILNLDKNRGKSRYNIAAAEVLHSVSLMATLRNDNDIKVYHSFPVYFYVIENKCSL